MWFQLNNSSVTNLDSERKVNKGEIENLANKFNFNGVILCENNNYRHWLYTNIERMKEKFWSYHL